MTPNDIIERFPTAILPEATAKLQKTIQYHITRPIHVVISNGTCEVKEGILEKYDVGITMNDDDLVAMMKGELNGMAAYMSGKLKIKGDLMFAQKIPSLFDLRNVLQSLA